MKISKFLLTLTLVGCAQTAKIDTYKPEAPVIMQVQRNVLVGNWYGEATTKDNQLRKSHMQRRADGTYTVVFQLFEGKKKTYQTAEAGVWGVSGNIYFTATREALSGQDFKPVDTSDPTYYDAYQAIEIFPEVFKYKSVETGTEYTVKKMPDDFKLK